ncbi:MAG: sugar ABC transporter permease [Actinobacteria bacterium]|nr:sugar ABC transporter permease [Actinomycetota bacterium]
MAFRYRMLAPLVALFVAVVGYPMVYSFWLSLTNYRITRTGQTKFVGLAQYQALLSNDSFWSALMVTATFMVTAVGLELVIGLGLAMALRRQKRVRDFTRSFLLSPMFVTPIAVGLMFRFLLNPQLGPLNLLLEKLHLSYDYFGPGTALFTLAFIDVWQWTPFMVLMLLAGLESLPRAPFEAARVDGASAWLTFRSITIPLLSGVLVVAVLLRGLDAMRVFEYVYAITRGGPGTDTQTIQYLIYQTGIQFFRLGQASAMAYVVLIIVLAIVIVLFRRMVKEARR